MHNKKFIALDLEINQPENSNLENPKICQIGICVGSRNQIDEEYYVKKWYVAIGEPVYPFITQLTGITDDDIATHGQSLQSIAEELGKIIDTYECFVNPVTWGGGDIPMLKRQFNEAGVHFPYFGRRWIDVKTIHAGLSLAVGKNPSGGLTSVMNRYKLRPIGTAHQADADALNTMRLFYTIQDRIETLETMVNLAKGIK